MTSPLQLAQDAYEEIKTLKSAGFDFPYEINRAKALGLLTAFINEKEFLQGLYGDYGDWDNIINRLKELTSAIDLLNKAGIKA